MFKIYAFVISSIILFNVAVGMEKDNKILKADAQPYIPQDSCSNGISIYNQNLHKGSFDWKLPNGDIIKYRPKESAELINNMINGTKIKKIILPLLHLTINHQELYNNKISSYPRARYVYPLFTKKTTCITLFSDHSLNENLPDETYIIPIAKKTLNSVDDTSTVKGIYYENAGVLFPFPVDSVAHDETTKINSFQNNNQPNQ